MPRYILHHLHFPHFDFHIDNTHNLKMLYGIRVLRELINNLCFFFLPLYLFQLAPNFPLFAGTSFNDFQKGMILVGSHFLLFRLAMLTTVVPVGKLITTKIGFKNAFIISRVLTVCVFLLLQASVHNPILVLFAAFLDGVEGAFFWPLFYSIFGKNSKHRRVGEDLGFLQFLLHFVAMAAPAIGGVVAVFLGFDKLFLFGLVLALLSVVFSVSMYEEKTGGIPSFKELLSWLKESRYRRLSVTYIGRYINDSVLMIWPLYVFLILKGVEKVGYLYSISMFIAMIASFFIGVYIDHHRSRRPFLVSGGILSLIWFLRSQVFDIWSIAFVDVANRLVSSFHWLFYDALMIKRGRGNRVYPFFIYREVVMSAGALLVWLFFISLFLLVNDWRILFATAAVGIAMSLLMNEKPNESGK